MTVTLPTCLLESACLGLAKVESFSPPARARGALWVLGASLHRLLPIVELNKEFRDFFENPTPAHGQPRNLNGWHPVRKVEMTPRRRRTRRAQYGITATRWAWVAGSRAKAGACRCAQRSP